MSKLAAALALAAANFRVFPLVENGEVPIFDGGHTKATTDAAQIEAWWRCPVMGWELDYNIGVATGGRRFVLDVDTRDGKRVAESLAALELSYGALPATLEAVTANGGRHLWFVCERPIGSSAAKLGPGLDVRGDSGYVVGPGSTIDGREYRWVRDTRYRVACGPRDMGVSEPMALELMLDHWNERCSPPWPADELAEGPVKSAYRYAQNALGQRAPEAQFSPIEAGFEALDPENVSRREGLFYVEGVDVRPELKQLALIKGLFDQAVLSVVFGASNSGKTFIMMSVSYHVVTGAPFGGRRTAQGNVVYVATEAGRSAERRVEALKRHFRWDGRGFFLIPRRVDLRRPNADTAALITLIREIKEKHGKVLMIVIDTLARALAGGDENSSQGMGAVIGNVDRIRTALRAHTAIVHHSGKDQTRG